MRRLAAALFLSGAAALACETVWLRMLSRVFGVTVHAVATLVAVYMGGLAIGALLASRVKRRPGEAYAVLEAGAAAVSLLATLAMTRLDLPPFVLAGLLLPPTILLGATLPIAARAGSASLLYASNTAGACAGALVAGFVTLGLWGELATVLGACAVSLAAAVLGWTARGEAKAAPPARAHWLLAAYALSGFCALGYEVLWTRQLIPLLGNSVYAFTLILAAYLIGLALGAAAPAKLSFGQGQLAVAGAALFGMALYTVLGHVSDSADFLYSPIRSPGHFAALALEALAIVFPLAFALGLLLPAALKLYPSVGPLYAVNTAGGILGSLAVGFVAIDAFGAWSTMLALTALNAALGLYLTRAWPMGGLLLLCALALRNDPTLPILSRRLDNMFRQPTPILFHEDTAAATVTGYLRPPGAGLLINGIDTAGVGPVGSLMAIIPNVWLEKPRSTLVICFGAGNTFRTASLLGGEVDAVDLVPALFRRMKHFYADADEHLAKHRLHAEDGRRVLLKADRTWDIIIVDATPPLFSAGSVNLYTREFFTLARSRLAPGGVMALWLPLPGFEEDYWRILSAYTEVFPHAATWRWGTMGGFLVLGSDQPLERSKAAIAARLRARTKKVARGLTADMLLDNIMLSGPALRERAARWPPLTDDKPVVEFPLPRFLAGRPSLKHADFLK